MLLARYCSLVKLVLVLLLLHHIFGHLFTCTVAAGAAAITSHVCPGW